MKLMNSIKKVTLLTLLMSASVAKAGIYHFDMSGSYTASWELNSTVVPDFVNPAVAFRVENVAGSFANSFDNHARLVFWEIGGGLNILDQKNYNWLFGGTGPQLYTGGEANPTFTIGSFALTDRFGTLATLVISEKAEPPVVTVPEPVSLALVGLGLLGLAGVRRRRA